MAESWEYAIVTKNMGDSSWEVVGQVVAPLASESVYAVLGLLGAEGFELAAADAPGERYFFKRPIG